MRCGEIRADQAELVQMTDQRGAVFLRTDHRLHAGFRDVHLHADAVQLRKIAAGDDEFVAAVMRDGGTERRAQPFLVPLPILDERAAGGDADVVGRRLDRLGLCALCGATLATYIFSKIIRGKLEIEDIANAALAGGVAIGSTCDMTTPGYAMLIGIAAGALSVVGYSIIGPKLEKLIKGTDTCGINNLHGMPGILGGVVAIFITGNAEIQLLGIFVTIAVAFICGQLTGAVISLLGKKELLYSDKDEFFVEG